MTFPFRHSLIDEVEVTFDGKPTGRSRLVFSPPLGRACLGIVVWFLLEDSRYPMSVHLRLAYAKAMRRNPERTIREFGEYRGQDVDPREIVNMLKGARPMRAEKQ